MKYEEIMDRIEVTPEMRRRVLRNVEAARARKKRQTMRQLVTLAACLAVVVCCWFAWKPRQVQEPEQGIMGTAQIETVENIRALSEKTGIPLAELTNLPFAVEHTEYVSYWGELAEIQYFGETNSLRYRKSQGTEDNSGDYNEYTQVETVDIAGNTVTLKGDKDGYSMAQWTDGSYAYSISVTEPISQEVFTALIKENFS